MTNEAYCYGCTHKPGCKEVCLDLEDYLDKESVKFKGMTSMMSTDFQDKVFSKEYKTDAEAWDERQRYVKRRKEAFGELVVMFSRGEKCCVLSVENLLVWQMKVLEGLTIREVAEITSISQTKVFRIIDEMKKKIKKY
jgi:predicted DNA-binding protein (UPF0251 family)